MKVLPKTRFFYCSYGMNCNHEQMAKRCPDAGFVDVVDVEGYKLVARGVLDIVEDPRCKLEMALWTVSIRDLLALDRLEGYPLHYDRIEILAVTRISLEPIHAMAYQMVSRSYTCKLSPSYRRLVTEGYSHCGMDPQQLKRADREANGPTYLDLLERGYHGNI